MRASSNSSFSAPKPRVAILFWEGHLALSPSMLGALRLLAEHGYDADIFMRGGDSEMPELGTMPEGVRIIKSNAAGKLRKVYPDQKRRFRFAGPLGVLLYLGFVLSRTRHERYDALFGVDPAGGVCALVLATLRRVPLFFWSLELSFASEIRSPLKRVLKSLERIACRKARWIIVQDPLRARALIEENRPGHARVLLVPNSPMGAGRVRTTDYLHRYLGLPGDRKILLHAGMMDPGVLCLELAQAAGSWPEPYALVLNAGFRRSPDEPYVRRLLEIDSPRVHVKLEPAPEDELDDLIASARFGLAVYAESYGPNYTLIVSASGKLPSYLRNGVPVICQDFPGMREMIEGYGCGVVVRNIDEIPSAIARMEQDYEGYRQRALACYTREYEFSRHFRKVLDALAAEIGPAAPVSPVEPVRLDRERETVSDAA
jgi:glycosyltransferase involved in cell wall biosynthesis